MSDTTNPYQTPTAAPSGLPDQGTYKPTLKQILFSFQGRIKRSQWWAAVGMQLLIFFVFILVGGAMLGTTASESMEVVAAEEEIGPMEIAGIVLILIGYFFVIWIGLASAVKRWHDRNKSGWWILISFVPLVGPIWALVENGCLAGVETGNRFGPQPE